MTSFIIELKPSTELMLIGSEVGRAIDRLAAALELLAASPARVEARVPEQPRPPGAGAWITEERVEVLRRRVPAGHRWAAIEVELAALPGAPLPSRGAICSFARQQLNLRRPDGAVSEAKRRHLEQMSAARRASRQAVQAPPVASPTPAPPPKPAPQPVTRAEALRRVGAIKVAEPTRDPGEPRAADFEQIHRFAAERGLKFASWDDLPAINQWCQDPRRNLPGFKAAVLSGGSARMSDAAWNWADVQPSTGGNRRRIAAGCAPLCVRIERGAA